MGITLAGAKLMGGTACDCTLDMYFRTIIYGLPRHAVQDEALSPLVLSDSSHFRAAIVVDPVSYLDETDFSDQFRSDRNSANPLRDKLGQVMEDANGRVYIVVQIKQDLDLFPAVDGQCRDINGELALINCGAPHVPVIRDSTDSINAVLTAIKMELDITDALDKHLDEPIYVTDGGRFVHWLNIQLSSATGSVTHPIGAEDLRAKVAGARVLVDKINQVIAASADHSDMSPERRQNLSERLAELIDALQLDPTLGDAYRRLWYLRLWNRVEEFGKAPKPRIDVSNILKTEKGHRNDIAHRGVDRADGASLRSLQQKLFGIIRDHV